MAGKSEAKVSVIQIITLLNCIFSHLLQNVNCIT